jgi:hypothetical protein
LNPFFVWAIIFGGFFILPAIFWPLLIIAFNAAHVVFFFVLLILSKKFKT